MKKLIAFFLSTVLCFSLAGCKKLSDKEIISFIENTSIVSTIIIKDETDVINSSEATVVTSSKTESKKTESSNVQKPSASKPTPVVIESKPSTSSESEQAPLQAPVVSEENDATKAHTDRISDIVESKVPQGATVTQQMVDDIMNEQMKKDGIVYYDSADFNDVVTMENLYYEPIKGRFNALDTKVMNAIKSKKETEIPTGIAYNADGEEAITEYMRLSLIRFNIFELQLLTDGKEFIIDTTPLIESIEALQNKVYYKNIQKVIKDLGIKKGMLQRDAIFKFNEYICSKVEYDYATYDCSLNGFFNEGKAICNSYTQVFELLCRTVGIDAEFIGNNVKIESGYVSHAWNKVTLSGKTVYFDICWNDGDIIVNGQKFKKNDRYMFVKSFTDRSEANAELCEAVGYYEFRALA